MEPASVIVIGASAGGTGALSDLVSRLPRELPAAIFVVLHIPDYSKSILADILQRRSQLPVRPAEDGEPIVAGQILVAPPEVHLLVEDGRVLLSHGPRENRHRPAIDPLFRSAARYYGPRVIGVVLTGMLDDGTSGLLAVKARGGRALVQDPEESPFASMPQSAIEHVKVDYILPIAQLADKLIELAVGPRPDPIEAGVESDRILDAELALAKLEPQMIDPAWHPGQSVPFSCPDCSGTLWELQEGGILRYRCRTGHALSAETLLIAQSARLEEALWMALRALEEKIELTHRLVNRTHGEVRMRFIEEADGARQQAEELRRILQLERFQVTHGDESSAPKYQRQESASGPVFRANEKESGPN